jgi:hypothetical protein
MCLAQPERIGEDVKCAVCCARSPRPLCVVKCYIHVVLWLNVQSFGSCYWRDMILAVS